VIEDYYQHINNLEKYKEFFSQLKEAKNFEELSKKLQSVNLDEILAEINAGVAITGFANRGHSQVASAYLDILYQPQFKLPEHMLPEDFRGRSPQHSLKQLALEHPQFGTKHYTSAIKELANQAVIFDSPRQEVYQKLQEEASAANLEIYSPHYWRNVAIGAGTGAALGYGLAIVLKSLFNLFSGKSKRQEGEEEDEEEGGSALTWLLPATGLLLGGYLGHSSSKYT
jgi:hypothetical protein